MKKTLSYILITALALALSSCRGDGHLDYSRVQAQTGGPEQGEWRDLQGTMLSLNSGNFTYTKGGRTSQGTYTIAGANVTLMGSGGTISASFPDPNGPLTIDGVALTKTD